MYSSIVFGFAGKRALVFGFAGKRALVFGFAGKRAFVFGFAGMRPLSIAPRRVANPKLAFAAPSPRRPRWWAVIGRPLRARAR